MKRFQLCLLRDKSDLGARKKGLQFYITELPVRLNYCD